ncbi:MAG TPA: FAD-linked oxidase C-terminal domain-containing protein [Euzebyales bacterium]
MTASDPDVRPTRAVTADLSDDRIGGLIAALRAVVRGEVRFDTQSRAVYATDGSNYRQVPIGVVVPRDVDDIVATVAACCEHDVPILGRGAGTSLAGQCCNTAVVIDCSKHVNRIIDIDPDARTATVEPGVVLDALRDAAAPHGLTYGPDPATHAWCTMGGIIGNNSCGVHALMAGKAVDNLEAMEVLTYDGTRLTVGATAPDRLDAIIAAGGRRGEIHRGLRALRDRYDRQIRTEYPDIPRRVSGYNLDELLDDRGFHVARALCGTESTCAITLRATVNLVANPAARRLLVLGFPDIFTAGDAVPDILEHAPIGCEVMDRRLISEMQAMGIHPDKVAMLPGGDAWMLVEFGADDRGEATARAEALAAALDGPTSRLFDDPDDERRIWEVRESALGATARVPGRMPTWEGWEDSAVHPTRIGDYLRGLAQLWDTYCYSGSWYGHIGDGCVHTRNNFELTTAAGIATWRRFMEDAAELCVSFGGSLSGEHGDGQGRGELLDRMYSPEMLDAFRAFKRLWDPTGRMNPGKVIDAYPLDSNLRLGTDFRPVDLGPTTFAFPDDGGSLLNASMRCVGVGKCRRPGSGDMCPSYQATREEVHSTRGRARLLFEMLRGDVTAATWRNDDVADALDLCISCKACARDCPVGVDMATYKAEFLSHHYAGRLRPRHAYALGHIDLAARLATRAPGLVNAVTHAPALRRLVARLAGITTEREIPRFTSQTLVAWFREAHASSAADGAHAPTRTVGTDVILWPDTFTNHLTPGPGRAAVQVLTALGFRVRLPDRALCCGRPLYDFGMLSRARRLLLQVLDTLRDDIAAGTPVVGVEPSCLAVFRDELGKLLPDDADAARLATQTFSLSEFVLLHRDRFDAALERAGTARPGPGAARLQAHCHQKAAWGTVAEVEVLTALGIDTEELANGCCGLAGSFGFVSDHYDVSMRIGEQLFGQVRDAEDDARIVADGFSCRTQIAHGTGRAPVHLAEVLRDALVGRAPRTSDTPGGPAAGDTASRRARWSALTASAGAVALGWLAARRRRP